ncbi:autophagy-related protein 13b-like [Dioscorea cayenensis subsp. rotundata]|uniref:Autophagy-related protein 13b-like n=1 Tax=Dioscorea cayennensis subsp. rotundata TaxID=55577 RepID=A0AB40B9H2_DIOCR|nr:autophagy-related protein 13b-like [Dioscorea cayenensis subsp. rotundata]
MAAPSSLSSSEKESMEQYVTEFFSKSFHTILDSRSPSSSSPSSSARRREDWFNLQLRGQPAELDKIKQWRRRKAEILVVDVVLRRNQRHLEHEKVVERWSIKHEIREVVGCCIDVAAVYGKVYKKSIVVLRSLYATARMLPAYKLFRELSSSSRCGVGLSLRVSPFMEPFTREEEAEMERFSFNPVDTPFGRLSLVVSYLPTLEDVSLEPPPRMVTELIPDYVGSPATDPFKRFNSLPSSPHPCVLFQNELLRTESAPVCSHGLPPSPSMGKGNKELLRMGGFQIGIALQKALSLGIDGVGKLHRLKIPSCSLVRNLSSRSFSKLSVLNDVADIDCPFALEVKEDIDASSKRIESPDGKRVDGPLTITKSEDASIGTLLQMLKTAAPLNKDLSKPNITSSQALKVETRSLRVEQNKDMYNRGIKLGNPGSISRIFKSRTTADALDELQNFKEIKNLLLRRGGCRILNRTHSPKSTSMN